MNIGLFGGAFDPIHNGHIAVATSCLKSDAIDKLWVIPTHAPPHKQGKLYESFLHRVAMTRLAFENHNLIDVIDIEKHLPPPNYTLNTLEHLQRSFPDDTFLWCIGSDSLIQLKSWYSYNTIIENWKLLVATRPEFLTNQVDAEILEKCIFVEHEPIQISSTNIRLELQKGKVVDEIPAIVYNYILEHKLYSVL
jgi:nicotinate-nucleotide adenylyltransferase